ncbi:MMPL family transporter [Vibrio sp. SCSIO 43133]|nr:MMPL family transporter [Vibrio sp. SCSIO 43133]
MNRFISHILRFPKLTLFLVLSLTALCAWYGQQHFKMNADLSSLVKQEGQWVENLATLDRTFPDTGNVVLLITSSSDPQLKQHVDDLSDALANEALYKDVFAPSSLSWFEQYSLGFFSDTEFQRLLETAQDEIAPAAQAARAQNINQYFGSLDKQDQASLGPLLSAIDSKVVDWQQLLKTNIELPKAFAITIVAQPDETVKEPNRAIIETIHRVIESQNLPNDIKVQITGQAALDFDEIADANNSITIAGSASLLGLVLILAIGIRSLRVILACYVTVLVGLVWTFAAGLFVVGSYNTISIVFMVMFIGLAVDFSIHLCLHIHELRTRGDSNVTSLKEAAAHSIRPLTLCALSSALGFLSFYPTSYTGLGELGIISALGMILGLAATFIIIPLFFTLFGYPTVKHQVDTHRFVWFGKKLNENKKLVVAASCLLAVGMGYGATQFKFDFSTLVLKNPNSESVAGLNALQQHGLGSSYQLYAIAKDQQEAQQWKKRLLNQTSVQDVTIASDFIPNNIEQRYLQLNNAINAQSVDEPMDYAEFRQSALSKHWVDAEKLPTNIDTQKVTMDLFENLSSLANNPEAKLVAPTVSQLPKSLQQRYIANSGEWLVAVTPKGDMTNVHELEQFISQVKKIASNATGRAVAEQEVGSIIVQAFQAAILMSVFGIALILIWTVDKKRDVILIFIPLGLAAITTLGMMHWFNLSMNMANIIVIPLIFGLGVDNGIHIVKRFRAVRNIDAFFKTSTPKASLISCLTTLATFGALIVAEHRGMHSIGLVLTIALSCILVFSLVLLPVLLELTKKKAT